MTLLKRLYHRVFTDTHIEYPSPYDDLDDSRYVLFMKQIMPYHVPRLSDSDVRRAVKLESGEIVQMDWCDVAILRRDAAGELKLIAVDKAEGNWWQEHDPS